MVNPKIFLWASQRGAAWVHNKIRITKSFGAERKFKVVVGTIPELVMIISWRGKERLKQMPRVVFDEREQYHQTRRICWQVVGAVSARLPKCTERRRNATMRWQSATILGKRMPAWLCLWPGR